MNILVDVDDTLTDFVEERNNLIKKYIEEKNLPYKILDINCTKSAKVANWPIEECCNFWKEIGTLAQLNCPCQKNSEKIMLSLKERGHKIIIVSARPDIYYDAFKYTKLWLEKNNISFDDIIIGKQNKKQSIIDNNIQLVIDDSIQTVTYASELGINSIMPTTKENQKFDIPEKCIRASSWNEIEKILVAKGIL